MGFGGSGGSGSSIAGASDTTLNNPLNDQVLAYDGVSSMWKNDERLPAQSSMVVITPTTARPTARTDISVFWVGHTTQPANALEGDVWMPDLGEG